MAEKLSITIALSGAEEIKRQLADVGKAGQDCFNDINEAAAEVGGFNKLDPSVVTAKLVETGVAGKDVAKVLNAVNQAGKMETLVNGLKAVENGFAKVQSVALALGESFAVGLVRSLTRIARLLPLAFAAATVGAIVNTTKQILELDAAAIKLGVSIEDLGKARGIFEAIGISAQGAKDAVTGFFAQQEKIKLEGVKEAIANLDEFGRSANSAKDWLGILRQAAQGSGEAAELARKKLAEMGQAVPGISAVAKEIEKIQQSALSTPDKIIAIINVLENMEASAERTQIANKLFGPEFTQALNAGGVQLEAAKQRLAGMSQPTQAAADAAARLSLEWEKLKSTFSVSVSPEALNAIALSLGQIRMGFEAIGAAVSWVNAAILSAFSGTLFSNTMREINTIIGLLASLGEAGFKAMKYIESAAIAAWTTVIGWIEKAIAAVRQFFGAGGGQAAAAGVDAGGFARGGIMGGRGTGTSDSNLAWLSRGEHVMPAYAVRQPGVLQLLEALRRSGGNLRGVLDRMGHFAMGGMVSAPAFARGGAVGGMSNVTIQFPGVQPITGLRASSAVVDELRRSAALAQVRAGGRKPSRYT